MAWAVAPVKVGLIARAEDRGLGHLTWEWFRHMQPDRTLVVTMGVLARGFPPRLDRYPGAVVSPFVDGRLDESVVRPWLEGLDVVYSAETFYDWRLIDWAADAGVRTVCHVMPEFFNDDTDRADVLWAPTSWRIDQLPARTGIVPVPVARDRWPRPVGRRVGEFHWLHVAGHRAMNDRNGTGAVARVVRHLRGEHRIHVTSQDTRLAPIGSTRSVRVTAKRGGLANYWDLYAGVQALVLPRRYGGLCLPAQEAMAAGLAVVMPDCEPQSSTWPIIPIPCEASGSIETSAGEIPLFSVVPRLFARVLDELAAEPQLVEEAQAAALEWASANSWDARRADIVAALALAVT